MGASAGGGGTAVGVRACTAAPVTRPFKPAMTPRDRGVAGGGRLDENRALGGAGAETWTWYETTGLPDVQYFGVANPTCEGCHSADGGRDRSLAPNIP